MSVDSARSSLELLYGVSRDLANEIELRPLLKRILTQSIFNVGAERGSIVVLNEQSKPIDAAIIYGDKVYSHTLQQLRETVEKGMAGWVVRHHKSVLVNDTRDDQRWVRRPDDDAKKTGAKSALCVPVLAHKKLVGVLTVVHPSINFFQSDHLSLLQSIADIAGIAILNSRLFEESQHRTRVMEALINNAISLNSSLRTEDVLQKLMEQTTQALNLEIAALSFLDATGENLEIRSACGENSQNILNTVFRVGEGFVGRSVIDGNAVISTPEMKPEIEQFNGIDVRAIAAVPVRAETRIIGVLLAMNPKKGEFDEDALLVMNAFGNLAGIAIRNALQFELLQTSNQRYTELFDHHLDPILITDLQGNILESNSQACDVLQYPKPAIVQENISKLHEINREKVGENFELIPPKATLNYESEMVSKNGWTAPVEVSVRRIQFSGVESFQWILRDITERIDLDSLRNDLIAMVYHDLRSPLANVTASLDILNSLTTADRDETTVNLLNIAMRSSDRIQRLLNSLLDVYRLESGQTIVNRSEADPLILVNEAVDILQPVLEAKNQNMVRLVSPDLPLIWVDNDMIRRVLVNLLENASKFSPVDSKIEVGARLNSDFTIFWVKDQGPGIAPEDQSRIFDKFSRLKVAGATKGMGLGLTFCRLAVNGHGGKIWVESNLNQGSTFYFSLPLKGMAVLDA